MKGELAMIEMNRINAQASKSSWSVAEYYKKAYQLPGESGSIEMKRTISVEMSDNSYEKDPSALLAVINAVGATTSSLASRVSMLDNSRLIG